MAAESPFNESLSALSRFLVGDISVEDTLLRVADLTLQAVPSAESAGITMLIEGRKRTAVFTTETAPEIDQAQYETGEGPCLVAFDERRVILIDSTRSDGPWPAFRRIAADHGIYSTLSLPMVIDKRAVGAMNLYADHEWAFSEEDVEVASLFASQASAVLMNAHAYWDYRDLSARLSDAMEHRAVIEQAKGILMAVQHCDDQAAFELLVRASQRENIKLRDIAARIVADTIRRG